MQTYHHRALNQEIPVKVEHELTLSITNGHAACTIAETLQLGTCRTACEATSVRR